MCEMTELTNPAKPSRLPNTSNVTVRQRWLDLLDLSYGTRRVSQQEIELGVHAIIVPAIYSEETRKDLIDLEVRAAVAQVPEMARGVCLALDRLQEFGLTLGTDYRDWMGPRGHDIAAGDTRASVFIDLAYLEAALLARLWDSEVLVEFSSPLSFFRRGALTDYANVYEAVVAMVFEGRSLADVADRLAPEILKRLQLYANAYLRLSSLYTEGAWHIERDTFVMKARGKRLSLALQYWELRGDHASVQKVLHGWRSRIENLLQQSVSNADQDFPKSFAA
jgi:hypothetical protein